MLNEDILGGHGSDDIAGVKSFVVGQFGNGFDGPSLPPAGSEVDVFGLVSAAAGEQADLPVVVTELDHPYRVVPYVDPYGAVPCVTPQ
jgi:hypothetical protein